MVAISPSLFSLAVTTPSMRRAHGGVGQRPCGPCSAPPRPATRRTWAPSMRACDLVPLHLADRLLVEHRLGAVDTRSRWPAGSPAPPPARPWPARTRRAASWVSWRNSTCPLRTLSPSLTRICAMTPPALGPIWASARGKVVPVVCPSVGATVVASSVAGRLDAGQRRAWARAPGPWAGGSSPRRVLAPASGQAGGRAALQRARPRPSRRDHGSLHCVHGPGRSERHAPDRPGERGLGQVIVVARLSVVGCARASTSVSASMTSVVVAAPSA